MLKLKRYLKPYLLILLVAVALLFGQAMLELTLPNYMSDIVNVGLQQGGITQAAPEAIQAQSMGMMQAFMSESDKATVNTAYAAFGSRTGADKLQKTYPGLTESDYVLIADAEASGANAAFSRASYALINVMKELSAQMGGSETAQSGGSTGSLDPAMLGQLMAALQQPQEG